MSRFLWHNQVMRKLLLFILSISSILAFLLFLYLLTQQDITLLIQRNPSNENSTSQNKENNRIKIIATGDVGLSRSVNYQIQKNSNPNWPFLYTKDILISADITLINLESPLIKNCPVTVEGFKFCGEAKNAEGLVYAGIDVANLANNHIGNYGLEGIEETKKILTSYGILYTGVEQPTYIERNGIKIAFLGFNEVGSSPKGIAPADPSIITKLVSEADKNADLVVASFHWGIEYTNQSNAQQIYLARLAVENGADLIIGNHPHWEQSEEYYRDVYIKYSHGNFVFDQMWSEETKRGVIGVYSFEKNTDSKKVRMIEKEMIPVYIENYGQPTVINNN